MSDNILYTDLDLCLEVVSRSCQLLRYNRRWISRKLLEIEAWLQRTTNRKWPMGYQMTSRDPQRCCEVVRSAILATAWLLVITWFTKNTCNQNRLWPRRGIGFRYAITFVFWMRCQMSHLVVICVRVERLQLWSRRWSAYYRRRRSDKRPTERTTAPVWWRGLSRLDDVPSRRPRWSTLSNCRSVRVIVQLIAITTRTNCHCHRRHRLHQHRKIHEITQLDNI